MKLYLINTSYCVFSNYVMFPDGTPGGGMDGPNCGDKEWRGTLIPIVVALIEHPDGWILFDTGFDVPFMAENNKQPAPMISVWNDEMNLVYQLGKIGVTPDDIKTVVISHLHPDHVGQNYLFPKATFYVPGIDMDAPHFPFEEGEGTYVKLYEETEIVPGVRTISLPGHTAGHTGLLVDLENLGTVLLTADAKYTDDLMEKRIVPRNVELPDKYIETLEMMEKMRDEDGIRLIAFHDFQVLDDYKMFPEYND